MSKLLIQTQVYENYGAHDWDGTGTCPEYWKAKGGSEYFVSNINTIEEAHKIMLSVRAQVEENSMYYSEHIIDWSIVADNFMTEYEKAQLDFEGSIRFPTKTILLEDLEELEHIEALCQEHDYYHNQQSEWDL